VAKLVVILSGGSRGLGQAIARGILESGHTVATFSRSTTAAIEEFSAHPDWSSRFLHRVLDARQSEALRQFVVEVHERFGRVDALINNAAVVHDSVLAMASEKEIDQMLDVNLKATLLLAKECARIMLVQQSGHIINISSIIGSQGFSGLATYAATKAGLDGMTRALARELGNRQIRVNAIAPGFLDTEMAQGLSDSQRAQIERRTPLGRLGRVEDIVPWVNFLLSPQSDFATGQVFTVDGGASI